MTPGAAQEMRWITLPRERPLRPRVPGNNHSMLAVRRLALLALLSVLVPAVASADDAKRCIDVQFEPVDELQIVAWVETAGGEYKDTIYITQQTGTFGLGNRPGRFDFNSGPIWPYGRRITTFPVWSHANGQAFPAVLFQNDVDEDPDYCLNVGGADYQGCGENNLSHPFNQSSRENHFCRPLMKGEASWDSATCATTAFTDKGRFSTDVTKTTGYPPRADINRSTPDSPSVDLFKMMNPFDAVSQPTPIGGTLTHAPWPVPADLGPGDYVLFVEASKEFDFNATYNATTYPSPMNHLLERVRRAVPRPAFGGVPRPVHDLRPRRRPRPPTTSATAIPTTRAARSRRPRRRTTSRPTRPAPARRGSSSSATAARCIASASTPARTSPRRSRPRRPSCSPSR